MTGLIRGNAVAIPLRDGSVDLVVTSPPYFALRSYQDGGEHYDGQIGSEPTPADFLAALWVVMDECWRVLKPGGSVWVNLGDKFSQRVAARRSSHQDGLFPDRPDLAKDWKRDRELGLARMPNQNAVIGSQFAREKSKMGLPWLFAHGCVYPLIRSAIDGTEGGPQWILRADVVWDKPNGMPESVTDRVRVSHEYWFHLVKSERYYANIDEIREARVEPANGAVFGGSKAKDAPSLVGATSRRQGQNTYDALNPLGKLPGSVWGVATEPLRTPAMMALRSWADMAPVWFDREADALAYCEANGIDRSPWPRGEGDGPVVLDAPDHFAAFPSEFPRRIILGWSPPGVCTACGEGWRAVVRKVREHGWIRQSDGSRGGDRHAGERVGQAVVNRTTAAITGYRCACPDTSAPTRPAVVLDPFSGTGTTAMMAEALGRFGIGIDLSADYLRLARWRITESGHAARSIAKAEGRRPPVKQPAARRSPQLALFTSESIR